MDKIAKATDSKLKERPINGLDCVCDYYFSIDNTQQIKMPYLCCNKVDIGFHDSKFIRGM